MRILYIANRADVFSGGQKSLIELLSGIDRSRFEPMVLCPGEGGLSEKAGTMGIAVITWEMPTARTLNIGRLKRKGKELGSIIRDHGADIVHSNGSRAQFYAARAVKDGNTPLIWHVREAVRDIFFYDRYLFNSADRVICVSEGVRERRFGRFRAPEEKVRIVYNGVDADRFVRSEEEGKAFRKTIGVGEENPLIGCLGILVPRKGHRPLLYALKEVADRYPEARLLIAGVVVDERYAADLKKYTRRLGIADNVIFRPFQEDVRPVLSALDMFVLPSESEGFSRVLLEAMAASLPVIATDISGNNEAVVDGESGLLVPYGDPDRLAGAMELVLTDAEGIRQMALNARYRVEEMFSTKAHVEKVQELYEELAGRP